MLFEATKCNFLEKKLRNVKNAIFAAEKNGLISLYIRFESSLIHDQ
jgi:hypothetical protein